MFRGALKRQFAIISFVYLIENTGNIFYSIKDFYRNRIIKSVTVRSVNMPFNWAEFNQLSAASADLFNKNFLSDIKFQFPCGRVIYAHSLFLAIRGEEFYNAFKDNVGTQKLIQINDYSYDFCYDLLKCIYESKDVELTNQNCWEILRFGKKNGIHDFQTKSAAFIRSDLKVNNVLKVLDMSLELKYSVIEKAAINFIRNHSHDVLGHESFVEISEETLKFFLKWPHSTSTETVLFNAIMKWARNACEKKGLAPGGAAIRSILGDHFKLLRFPTMTTKEFGDCIATEPDLLNSEEIGSIFMNIASKRKNTFGFLDYKRFNQKTSERLQITGGSTTKIKYSKSTKLVTKFQISKSIELTGIDGYTPKCNEIIQVFRSADRKEMHRSSYTILYESSWSVSLQPPVLFEANQEYEIISNFEGLESDNITGYQKVQSLPLCMTGSKDVVFNFTEISPNIEILYYNVV